MRTDRSGAVSPSSAAAAHALEIQQVPEAVDDDFESADAILLGTPTRY